MISLDRLKVVAVVAEASNVNMRVRKNRGLKAMVREDIWNDVSAINHLHGRRNTSMKVPSFIRSNENETNSWIRK